MPKLKEPSQRAVHYVANTVSGMGKKHAALSAGYSAATAHNAHRAIEIQPVVQTIKEALDNEGITLERIAQDLRLGLEAVKFDHLRGHNVTVVDFAVRHRYVETIIKLFVLTGSLKKDEDTQIPIPILGGLSTAPIYVEGAE